MKKTTMLSIKDVNDFVKTFLGMITPSPDDEEEKKIRFIQRFIEWLMARGIVFLASRKIEEHLLFFSSVVNAEFPIRISVRYESGLPPICYWIGANGRKNHVFDDLQINSAEELYRQIFELYIKQ